MFLKQLFLVFLGLSAGGVIAAGVFAFLAIIGVFPWDLRAGGRNLCRLPRHVSGGDFKGPAGYQQENSSGRGTSVRDPGHRSWQAHRFTRIFHGQFRTVENRNRR